MSLETWQAALVGALTTDAAPAFASAPGFRLTRRVQREWRAFRIRSSLPLTCRLLGPRCADAIDRYLDAVLEPSSFFLREAEQFVAHCRFEERATADHLCAVVRFELAMLRGVQARAGHPAAVTELPPGEQRVVTHWAADVIPFGAPPERVLMAAASGGSSTPLPTPTGRHPLLCTPLACRMATTAEDAVFARVRDAVAPTAVVVDATVRALHDAGALVPAGARDG